MGVSYRPLDAAVVRTGSERATLVRRTYLLILASIFVTMGGVWYSLNTPAVFNWVVRHPILTLLGMFLPLLAALRLRQSFPINIGLVFLFTFAEGIMISPLIYYYAQTQPGLIGQAAMLTGSTFAVLTVYAWVSRRDFSAWGGFFTIGLWVLIATSLLNLFFRNATASLWIAGATVFIFGGLLVWDTWRLRNQFGPNDYVQAAVAIYLDLLNMFLAILSLLGGRRE
ncbi:MAG TPA: Bax inhibitor-1/YccA family protein [Gemmatimonadaceae bacterium]|nr:Bax inhibitor-1/YccA family protein [Gemmatimonadaceae bacterium]